ncbi:MAG: MASE1 domain-containing protein [Casimicrobiaceae bacterium]
MIPGSELEDLHGTRSAPTDGNAHVRDAGYATVALAYIVAYGVLDWVSYIHPLGQLAITPWNPPPGLSLFVLLRYGLRFTPVLFVAAVLAEFLVRGVLLDPALTIGSSLLLAAGYAAAGALLVRRLNVGRSLRNMRDVNRFVGIALVAPLVIAVPYVGLHVAVGAVAPGEALRAALQFWIGDAIGIAVTTPLLLEYSARSVRWRRRIRPELVLQTATIVLALWIVFGIKAADEFKFFYLLFLPPIWIAMRHGVRGAVASTLAIQLGLIAGVDRIPDKGIALFELQFLMLTLALTMLYLGMAVTERAAAQRAIANRDAALNRALRMATAGELSAAIAHELNQPLSAIGTYARACIVMLDEPTHAHRLRETLDRMAREVSRAGEVIRGLRDFYRAGSGRREHTTARGLVGTVLESLGPRLTQAQVDVEVSYGETIPDMEVDRVQMQAVFHNVIANAVDAIGEARQRGGRIAIAVRAHGPGLRFVVADDGPGIVPSRAARLFEAFNSTKPEGMGLGLAMSRSIVEAHGGQLVQVPSPLGGAAFEITLPCADDDDDTNA